MRSVDLWARDLRVHLGRALPLVLCCAACSPPARPEAVSARPTVTPTPRPVPGAHVQERRWLGLDAAVVARRLFSANYNEVGQDGDRSGRWTCAFTDRAGADLDARDERGRTALHLAAEAGSMAVVRALLSGGADVRAEDVEGNTALHAAALRGDVEMIDELFGAGALVDAENRAGATPLGFAARAGQAKAVAALIDRGADPARAG